MTAIAERFTLSLPQLGALGAFLVIALALSLVGAVLGGKQRLPEADLVGGWAAVSLVFTVAGTVSALPFTYLHYAVLAAATAAGVLLWRRNGGVGNPAMLRILVLGAPLVVLVAGMASSQWDEFTHWLPNARFLLEHDGFPRRGLPASPSNFPAYPHALALVIYMTSRLAGHMVENAGALFNLLLLLSFGLLVARVFRQTLSDADPAAAPQPAMGWRWCALGALAVTVLNPSFVPKVIFTAYADAGTTIALGFAAAFAWTMLNALAEDRPQDARRLAWQTGLAATALVNVKQIGVVLFVLLVASATLVAWRDPRVGLRRAMARLPAIAVLPLVVYAAWRLHVAFDMDGGEFVMRPLSEWSIALVPDVLTRMALVASKKGVFFGLMIVAAAFAARALIRPRTAFDRLAIITAAVFVFYNGFLLVAYISAFGRSDALRAASYWRYNLHLGGVGLIFAACGIALLWRRLLAPRLGPGAIAMMSHGAMALVIALPFALSHKVRFDAAPGYARVRAAATDLARMLTPEQRILLVDVNDSGQYLMMLRYALHGSSRIVGEVTYYSRISAEKLRALTDERRADRVWVREAVPLAAEAFGVALQAGSSHLLARRADGWTVERSWPGPSGQQAGGPAMKRAHDG